MPSPLGNRPSAPLRGHFWITTPILLLPLEAGAELDMKDRMHAASRMRLPSIRNDIVWYTEFSANYMVRFDPATAKFTSFVFPTADDGKGMRSCLGFWHRLCSWSRLHQRFSPRTRRRCTGLWSSPP